jgi:hypothetical protein
MGNDYMEKQAGPMLKKIFNILADLRKPKIIKGTVENPIMFNKPRVKINKAKINSFSDKTVLPSIRYADLSVPTKERLKDILASRRQQQSKRNTLFYRLKEFLGLNKKQKQRIPSSYYASPETPRQQVLNLVNRIKKKIKGIDYNDHVDLKTLEAARDLKNGYSYRRQYSPSLSFFTRSEAKAPFAAVPDFTNPDLTRAANAAAKLAPAGEDYIKANSLIPNIERSHNVDGLIANGIEQSTGQRFRILRPGQPHINGDTTRNPSVYETINAPNSPLSNIAHSEIYVPYDKTIVNDAFRAAGIPSSAIPKPVEGTSLWGNQGTLFRGSNKENLLKEVPENLFSKADAKLVNQHIREIDNLTQGGIPQYITHPYTGWRWYTPSLRRALGYADKVDPVTGRNLTRFKEHDMFVKVPVSVYKQLAVNAPKNPNLPTQKQFRDLAKDIRDIYQHGRLPNSAWQLL